MPAYPHDRFERRNHVVEARTEGWTQADSEKAHLADRAGRERLRAAEPSACSHMVSVRLPSTGNQKVHVEQVTHASSSRSALTVSVVIFGADGAQTRTGRPNLPRVSLAPPGALRSRINPLPSSVTSILSPGRRFNALRNRVGMTSCPLVESVDQLMIKCLTRLTRGRKQALTLVAARGRAWAAYHHRPATKSPIAPSPAAANPRAGSARGWTAAGRERGR